MCGRARSALGPADIVAVTGGRARVTGRLPHVENAYPGCRLPLIRLVHSHGASAPVAVIAHSAKWGLVPSWTKRAPDAKLDHFSMFNARSETAGTKGVFSRLLRGGRRCVVPVNGFIEWVLDGKGEKQPVYVNRADGQPLLLAGLFDVYAGATPADRGDHAGAGGATAADGDGDEGAVHDDVGPGLMTFTVLTREPVPELAWLHDRMPVMFPHWTAGEAWLRGDDTCMRGGSSGGMHGGGGGAAPTSPPKRSGPVRAPAGVWAG